MCMCVRVCVRVCVCVGWWVGVSDCLPAGLAGWLAVCVSVCARASPQRAYGLSTLPNKHYDRCAGSKLGCNFC